jgi:CRP-like cAMP-binding protein
VDAPAITNRLLLRLPRTERDGLLRSCEPFELVFGDLLCEADRPYRHVYFPLSGFISILTKVGGHPALELGLIGDEGMLGATLALGVGTAPLRAQVQGAGTALRLTAARFRDHVDECPALRRMVDRYLYVSLAQLAQTAACTHFHDIESRLARWLLMSNDRLPLSSLHLTHGFLADMLGVQRSAVTIAAGALQRRDLISYARGEVKVVDRKGLEAASCSCYAATIDDYRLTMR